VKSKTLRSKLLIASISTVMSVGSLEVFSKYYYEHVVPSYLHDSAEFVLDNTQGREPKVIPYIWANYKPNPASPQANEYGWRYGGEPKEESVFRILCLGGSTTWSDGVKDPKDSYPARLENYLQNKGYNVDVVNGGAPGFTSAELVGTFAFRGVFTEPNLVIIHTGENDIGAFLSSSEYKSDYTHWRDVDLSIGMNNNAKFKFLWELLPSSTIRLWLTYHYKPDSFADMSVSTKITAITDSLLAENDVSGRVPTGLRNNLENMIGIAQVHDIDVVGVTFNMRPDKLNSYVPQVDNDPALKERVTERLMFGVDTLNETIETVFSEFSYPVIDFASFEPSHSEDWLDLCHLNKEGSDEKARFFGNQLIELGVLPAPYSVPVSLPQ